MFDLNPVIEIYCVKIFHKSKNKVYKNSNTIHTNEYEIPKNRTLSKKQQQQQKKKQDRPFHAQNELIL